MHTPGPWHVSSGGICDAEMRDVLCREDYQESLANAHLIAAAPEMLATLRQIQSWVKKINFPNTLDKFILTEVEIAIRKAEGKNDPQPKK